MNSDYRANTPSNLLLLNPDATFRMVINVMNLKKKNQNKPDEHSPILGINIYRFVCC